MAAYVASIFPHGGALIYGSQEVGYPEPINFFKYVPVDWSAKPDVYQEYKKLIGLYNEHPALRKGTMTPYPDNDVLVFEKQDGDEHFLILVNVRNENKTVQVPQSWVGHEVEDEATGKELRLNETIEMEPFEYLILE
jgi:glycosidase